MIGYRKGALGQALSEEAQLWINQKSKKNSLTHGNFKRRKRDEVKK